MLNEKPGFKVAQFPQEKITVTKLTIHGPDCDTKPEMPQFKPYNNGLWHVNFGVVDREGLVLQDVNLYNSHLLDILSMPHSKVILPNGQEDIIRYCSSTDKHIEPQQIGDPTQWSFSREFGENTPDDASDDGTLLTTLIRI